MAALPTFTDSGRCHQTGTKPEASSREENHNSVDPCEHGSFKDASLPAPGASAEDARQEAAR